VSEASWLIGTTSIAYEHRGASASSAPTQVRPKQLAEEP
jgi:hypothetical protein